MILAIIDLILKREKTLIFQCALINVPHQHAGDNSILMPGQLATCRSQSMAPERRGQGRRRLIAAHENEKSASKLGQRHENLTHKGELNALPLPHAPPSPSKSSMGALFLCFPLSTPAIFLQQQLLQLANFCDVRQVASCKLKGASMTANAEATLAACPLFLPPSSLLSLSAVFPFLLSLSAHCSVIVLN